MKAFERCLLCPRQCGVNRNKGELGGCGSSNTVRIARAALHYWEEPVISGKNGSGAVFFTGCQLKCVYCQNYEISTRGTAGKTVTPEGLSEIFRSLEEMGANNINLVSGTQYTPVIAEALKLRKPQVPVVYNTSGYEKVDTLKMLEGLVDIYLPDFKYATAAVAQRYSSAPDYPEIALKAIGEMIRQCGSDKAEGGLMKKGVLIRHLVLPLNVKNSILVLNAINEHFKGVKVSLMSQYIPEGRAAEFSEINRKITPREYSKAVDEMLRLGIDGYVQAEDSARGEFIPDFEI